MGGGAAFSTITNISRSLVVAYGDDGRTPCLLLLVLSTRIQTRMRQAASCSHRDTLSSENGNSQLCHENEVFFL